MISLMDKEVRCPVCTDKNVKALDEEKRNVFGYEEETPKVEVPPKKIEEPKETSTSDDDPFNLWHTRYSD